MGEDPADVDIHAPLHGGVGLAASALQVSKFGEVFLLGLHGRVRRVVREEAEEGLLGWSHLADCLVGKPIGQVGVVDFCDRVLISEELVVLGLGKVVVATGVNSEKIVEPTGVRQHTGNRVADVPLPNDRCPVSGFFEVVGNGLLFHRNSQTLG